MNIKEVQLKNWLRQAAFRWTVESCPAEQIACEYTTAFTDFSSDIEQTKQHHTQSNGPMLWADAYNFCKKNFL